MMNNYMITEEQAKKDKLMSFEYAPKNSDEFMGFFMLFLDTLVNFELASGKRVNQISELLLSAMSKKADNLAIIISNYIYILNMYILENNNWEIWQKLNSIQNVSSAQKFLEEVIEFFYKKISRQKLMLIGLKKNVIALDNLQIQASYEQIVNYLELFEKFETEDANLRELVDEGVFLTNYIFINETSKGYKNIIEDISIVIHNLSYEVSILRKFNGKNILKAIEEECSKIDKNASEREFKIDEYYEKKLADLDKKYYASAKGSYNVEKRNKYESEKERIRKEWQKKIDENEKLETQRQMIEGELSIRASIPSLIFAIKEYALYSMSKKGKIQYPATESEKSICFMKMDDSEAIKEFLEISEEIRLSENEISYLKKGMKK